MFTRNTSAKRFSRSYLRTRHLFRRGNRPSGVLRRRLRLECLEDRRLLSGSVMGDLILTGVASSPDITPPTLIGTSPSFGTSGTLEAGTNSLTIEFSEPVLGGDGADNYQLQSLGPDGLLGTTDDIILPLSVSHAGTTATLSFPALPESVYRLTVRDTITDAAGNQLEGGMNGTLGGDWREEFVAVPGMQDKFAWGGRYDSGGSWLESVTVGDFNADGKSDLAVANEGQHGQRRHQQRADGGHGTPHRRCRGCDTRSTVRSGRLSDHRVQ